MKNIENIKEENFLSIFKDVNASLKIYKINAWMDAGLLLKYSRGQNLYPSTDIDFGVKSEDINKIFLFSKHMKEKGYLVTTLGNTSVIFDGITIAKKITKDHYITVDIYVYYSLKNYFCRPNIHKPLKQSYLSITLFRIFNKFSIMLNSNSSKKLNVIHKIISCLFFYYSKLYFKIAITSQFAIPINFFKDFKYIKIHNEIILIPKRNIEYIEWRYGSNWKIPNKNWRLTDGNMVFLNNLKNYWNYFCVAPNFEQSKFSIIKSNINRKSIFKFDDKELKIIKKSKIKSEL